MIATTTRIYKPTLKPQSVVGAELLGVTARNTDELIAELQKGLDFKAFEKLALILIIVAGIGGMNRKKTSESVWLAALGLGLLIGMSESTYQRRKVEQKLTPKESEGVYRYAALMARATEVFGSSEAARGWLNQPVRALGDKIPLEYARTEVGANLVMQILGRIEHGAIS